MSDRAVIALLVASIGATGCASIPPSAPSPALGKPVTITLPSDRGQLVTLPLEGVPTTVVEVFAPSCQPCGKTLPALVRAQPEIEAASARLVLVAVLADGETTEQAAAALRTWGVDAAFLVDHGGAIRAETGIAGLPATFIVDRRATLRWVAPPSATPRDIARAARRVAE